MAGGFDQWFISTGCVVQVSMSGRRAADVSSPVGPLDVLRPDAVLGVWLLFLFLMRQRRRKDDVVLDRLPSPSSSVDISFLSSLLISTVFMGALILNKINIVGVPLAVGIDKRN